MGWIIAAIVAIFVGAFVLWTHGDQVDMKRCKMTYGQEYTLGHSPANSSVKWCQAPDGTQKALPL